MKPFLTSISDPAASPVYGYDVYFSWIEEVPIPTNLIVCQAFRDDAGKRPLGKTFGLEPAEYATGPFARGPFGGQRFSRVKILPGSILCSDAAGIHAYVKSRPANGIPVVKAVPRRYVLVESFPDPDSARYFDNQQYVLVDNAVYPFTVKPLTDDFAYPFKVIPDYVDTFIRYSYPKDDRDRTRCQLYEDKNGTKSAGQGLDGYDPNKVQSIRCRLLSSEELLLAPDPWLEPKISEQYLSTLLERVAVMIKGGPFSKMIFWTISLSIPDRTSSQSSKHYDFHRFPWWDRMIRRTLLYIGTWNILVFGSVWKKFSFGSQPLHERGRRSPFTLPGDDDLLQLLSLPIPETSHHPWGGDYTMSVIHSFITPQRWWRVGDMGTLPLLVV